MKSLIKSVKNFFKSIWKSFDKRIITPLTKVVLKFTDNNENSGKLFENWLSKRNTLLFISLFLALTTFIVIDTQIVTFSKNSAEVLRSLPVTAIYNEEAYVAEGLPSTVDITLIGSKTTKEVLKYLATSTISHACSKFGVNQYKFDPNDMKNMVYHYNKNNPNYCITICCIFKYYLKEGRKYG